MLLSKYFDATEEEELVQQIPVQHTSEAIVVLPLRSARALRQAFVVSLAILALSCNSSKCLKGEVF
jgi:hypothetical protein